MNPLKRGFLDTIKAVKENKLLFVILVLVQILFIISVSFVGVKYQIKIYENMKGVIEPLESINYDGYNIDNPESLEQPFMKEMMEKMVSVTKNYKEMVENILKMVFLILGCFLVLNGLNWSIANRMIKRNNIIKYWGKFILVSLVFLAPVSLSSYLILKSFMSVELELFRLGVNIAGVVFLVVIYFMLIGFCLVEERLKDLFKKIFLIGIKKAHWILLSLLCCLLSVSLSLIFIYFCLGESNFSPLSWATGNVLLMVLGALILAAVLALGKLFLAGVVKSIKKE